MTERPIFFGSPMVCSILEKRKHQTRRTRDLERFNAAPGECTAAYEGKSAVFTHADGGSVVAACPYGVAGDRLWVREGLCRPDGDPWCYKADGQPMMVSAEDETAMLIWAHHKEQDYCPSIHMPRWASRITLEITQVRVEQLNDITEEDILAEGITVERVAKWCNAPWSSMPTLHDAWRVLWDSINGKKKPYASNPWVWVIGFDPLEIGGSR